MNQLPFSKKHVFELINTYQHLCRDLKTSSFEFQQSELIVLYQNLVEDLITMLQEIHVKEIKLDSLENQLKLVKKIGIVVRLMMQFSSDIDEPFDTNNYDVYLKAIESSVQEINSSFLPTGDYHPLAKQYDIIKNELYKLKWMILERM